MLPLSHNYSANGLCSSSGNAKVLILTNLDDLRKFSIFALGLNIKD